MIRTLVLTALLACVAHGQTKTGDTSFNFMVCVDYAKPFGEHVRFTPEEHVQVLLNEKAAREGEDFPYLYWERASKDLDWFSGPKPVSLKYIKSHMPRAMLLELQFPVDQNPHVDPKGVERLLAAEKSYQDALKLADISAAYVMELMKKYGVGPSATFDADMGGIVPSGKCNKYEERTESLK